MYVNKLKKIIHNKLIVLIFCFVVVCSFFICFKKDAFLIESVALRQKDGSETETETISYDKDSYVCQEGEEIETFIKVSGGRLSTIKSFETTEEEIATVDENTSKKANCTNCKLIRIVCKKKGITVLKAESSSGIKTSSDLIVVKKKNGTKEKKEIETAQTKKTPKSISDSDIGSISYAKTHFSCNVGESFETMIKSNTSSGTSYVKSFSVSNSSIASIDTNTTYQVNCRNCLMVRVVCKREGNVSLKATSSTGATTTSKLSVNETPQQDIGTISYTNSSYSCNVGETFETTIKAVNTAGSARVSSYSVSDTSVATIDNNTTIQVNCLNCQRVRIICKKKGNVSLKATSSTGATTSSSLVVNEAYQQDIGSISFSKNSYSCKVGESFETMIKSSLNSGTSYVQSYSVSDNSIATIDTNTQYQVNCYNCLMVRVRCLEKGNGVLKAMSSTGAQVFVPLSITD